jgi:hypothetical protein
VSALHLVGRSFGFALILGFTLSGCSETPFGLGSSEDCFSYFSADWRGVTDVSEEVETARAHLGDSLELPQLPLGYRIDRAALIPSSEGEERGFGVSMVRAPEGPIVEAVYAKEPPCEVAIYADSTTERIDVGGQQITITQEVPPEGERGLERTSGNLRARELYARLTLSWSQPAPSDDQQALIFSEWARLLADRPN